jgi:hypothetical protein
MPSPKLKHFHLTEKGTLIRIYANSTDSDPELIEELEGLMTTIYFQTKKHMQIDLFSLYFIPLDLATLVLNFGKKFRDKKRVVVLTGIPLPFYHYLVRFDLDQLFFIPEQDGIRHPEEENATTTPVPVGSPNLPIGSSDEETD